MNMNDMVLVPRKALRDFIAHSACAYMGHKWSKNKSALLQGLQSPDASGLTEPEIFSSWRTTERGRAAAEKGNFNDVHLTNAEALALFQQEIAELRRELSDAELQEKADASYAEYLQERDE